MIKDICTARQILQYGKTRYLWRLPIFDIIGWDDGETEVHTFIPSFCLLHQHKLALPPTIANPKLALVPAIIVTSSSSGNSSHGKGINNGCQ